MAQSKSPSGTKSRPQQSPTIHATVSGRWLLTALAISIPAAALCTWTVLCLLFWQGSWQLVYRPAAAVTRTPSNVGIAYEPVSLATDDAGVPQLHGWWI